MYLSSILYLKRVGFLRFLYFSFDADMDVSCSACVLVSRGEDSKVLQVWQLCCPALEGQSKYIRNLSTDSLCPVLI